MDMDYEVERLSTDQPNILEFKVSVNILLKTSRIARIFHIFFCAEYFYELVKYIHPKIIPIN